MPLAPAEVMATDGDGSSNGGGPHNQVYKLVLTGGPCGGKTTGQERLATFFEGLGWKVREANRRQSMVFKVYNLFPFCSGQ